MLMEWLEPSLEKSIDKVFDSYIGSDKYNELNKKIMDILISKDNNMNIDSKYLELESLLWSISALSVEYSYRAGFGDAMNIYSLNENPRSQITINTLKLGDFVAIKRPKQLSPLP